MTIEDIGLEPVFDDEPIEDEPAEKTPKKKKTAKGAKQAAKAEPVEEQTEEVAAKTIKKKKKKQAKNISLNDTEDTGDAKQTAPKRKMEISTEVNSEEPPKKLNRKQTKMLKREQYRKENPDQSDAKPEAKPSASKEVTKAPAKKKEKEWIDYRALDDKYRDILDKMFSTEVEGDAKDLVNREVASGRIEKAEFDVVMQRWRQQKRRMKKFHTSNEIVDSEGTLEDVKKMVNDLVKKRKINYDEAANIVKKWKIRESRRIKRIDERSQNRPCFHCRLTGHVAADCPQKKLDGFDAGEGICFKCGSMEHQIGECKAKHVRGYPFATCYICKEQGHISRDCEQNSRGIYPDGGECGVCGSKKHLKRDCPELAAQKEQPTDERKIIAKTMDAMTRADDDFEDDVPKKSETTKKKKKVVKF